MQVSISTISAGATLTGNDLLVVEEPLEIVLCYYRDGAVQRQSLSITMRTPGNDFDLVRGFLLSEGIVQTHQDILTLEYRGKQALQTGASNVVLASLSPDIAVDLKHLQRHFTMNSACGVCGKASLEALEHSGAKAVLGDSFSISESDIIQLPLMASELQLLYRDTGGAHAAAAFDARGHITCLREDIGRHNALDKLTGALAREVADNAYRGVFVSGRASFELLQKTAMAGFPFFAAVGAPSSLAVELARDFEITLVGFLRNHKFNVYNRPDRVAFQPSAGSGNR